VSSPLSRPKTRIANIHAPFRAGDRPTISPVKKRKIKDRGNILNQEEDVPGGVFVTGFEINT
jgi:hypothetical protein